MTVQIRALELSGFDDLGMPSWAHGLIVAATGGVSLAWDKTAQRAVANTAKKAAPEVGKGVVKIAKATEKMAEKVMCPVAKQFKDGKTAEAAAKSGYGLVAVVAANAVSSLCPKGKPVVEEKKVDVVVEKFWYDNPWAVGGIGVAAGLVLAALFAR